jgi:hypothetical protein
MNDYPKMIEFENEAMKGRRNYVKNVTIVFDG